MRCAWVWRGLTSALLSLCLLLTGAAAASAQERQETQDQSAFQRGWCYYGSYSTYCAACRACDYLEDRGYCSQIRHTNGCYRVYYR